MPEAEGYELAQAQNKSFSDAVIRYRGKDTGFFVSGLAEGTYFFRVRALDSGWSAPLLLKVEYPPARLVAWMVARGLVVFALTVGAIIAGHFCELKGVRLAEGGRTR